jgi:hypothetical protein
MFAFLRQERRQLMTLAEELRRKYALTSLKAKGARLALLAINEALEAATQIADQENSPVVASRIRSLKWTGKASVSVSELLTETA